MNAFEGPRVAACPPLRLALAHGGSPAPRGGGTTLYSATWTGWAGVEDVVRSFMDLFIWHKPSWRPEISTYRLPVFSGNSCRLEIHIKHSPGHSSGRPNLPLGGTRAPGCTGARFLNRG